MVKNQEKNAEQRLKNLKENQKITKMKRKYS